MKLNCRPGDLAVIVKVIRTPSLLGRIVKCVRLLNEGERVDGYFWIKRRENAWLVESCGGPMEWAGDFVMRRALADEFLRPIRDSDEPDETLQWVDVPSKQTA